MLKAVSRDLRCIQIIDAKAVRKFSHVGNGIDACLSRDLSHVVRLVKGCK